MTDDELDHLLSAPLPEQDAGAFSVAVMERIAQAEARPARILLWSSVAVFSLVIALACAYGAMVAGQGTAPTLIPAVLAALTLLLSFTVMRSAQA